MTTGPSHWLRTALVETYPPSLSSDSVVGDSNACISQDVTITVNNKFWTRDEYTGRAADVAAPATQMLRIGDLVVAKPAPDDNSIWLVAASYEVIRQAEDSSTQYRIFANMIASIGRDEKVTPSDKDDGRRIMTINEERWEGIIEYSQPNSASPQPII